jgi:hypothetical protein
MARLKFGRPISLRWNGLLLEGPAETVFEIPDEYYEEFDEDIGGVEPTLVWLDSDEGETIRDRLDALEAGGGGGGAALSNDLPLALGTAAAGTGTEASRDDHVHPTTGLALAGHTHAIGEASFTTVVKQYVKNDSVAKEKGEVVYISSADGTNPIVSYADADTEATSSKTLGLLETALSANQHGYVITEGIISGINTSTATAGQAVWLSSTAGGRVYGSPPAEPAHSVYLGVVTKANASTGEIFVKVQNGYEIDELHDVSAASPTAGDLLQWATDGTTYMWRKKSLSDAGISATSHNHNGTYANTVHTHAQTDVSSLVSDLAGKSDTGHAHAGVYDPAGTAASAVSNHEGTTDPHPIYLTSTEGNATYAATSHSHSTSNITSGNFVATVTGGTGVTVTSGTGNASTPTVAIGQAVGTASNVQFNNVQSDGYVKIPNIIHSGYSLGGSATSTTITTAGTYYALTSQEVSFTPAFVGQKFLVTYSGYVSINTTTIQYTFVRVDVTDSSNTQVEQLGFARAENFGTTSRGQSVSFMDIWTADSTSARKIKLYGTNQTTNGLSLTTSYTSLNVIAIA